MPEMFVELVRYRGLLAMLAWRDIRVRYKQSLLGFAWALLMPLIQTLVLWAIFRFGVNVTSLQKGQGGADPYRGIPYFLFVLSGVIPWTLFNATLAASVESLTRNSRLVTKIYFPREVFPLATVGGALVDFAVSLLILIPAYLYYAFTDHNVHPSWMLGALPLVLIVQLMLVSGLSLILSMANLFFRDVKYLMTFVLQLWFFATNVMYEPTFNHHPALGTISKLNPMIAILTAYRDCLMGHGLSDPIGLVCATVASMIVLLGGWWIFHRAEFKFAEYI
jgi:ABC-type polysaccharide/polyol phosphate export permease